jgi:hypothetical protein
MTTNLRCAIAEGPSYTDSPAVDRGRVRGVSSAAEAILMHRTRTFLFLSLVSSLALTACPEKKAEKEPPVAPETEENAAAEAAEDEEAADQKKPEEKRPEEKKGAEDEKADEGGW